MARLARILADRFWTGSGHDMPHYLCTEDNLRILTEDNLHILV